MPNILLFVGLELRYTFDRNTIGSINYSTNPSRFSTMRAHHLSITERTGGKHYDFFVKTPAECETILDSLVQSVLNQEDVIILLDEDCNSQDELARLPN